MNTSDLIVRIERIIGNINPKRRVEVESLVEYFRVSAADSAPVKTVSEPLSAEEIALVRESLKALIHKSKTVSE